VVAPGACNTHSCDRLNALFRDCGRGRLPSEGNDHTFESCRARQHWARQNPPLLRLRRRQACAVRSSSPCGDHWCPDLYVMQHSRLNLASGESVIRAARGNSRPLARKASARCDPTMLPSGGSVHGSLARSASAILRRRDHGLREPATTTYGSSNRCS